jgi:hypothetical protein
LTVVYECFDFVAWLNVRFLAQAYRDGDLSFGADSWHLFTYSLSDYGEEYRFLYYIAIVKPASCMFIDYPCSAKIQAAFGAKL